MFIEKGTVKLSVLSRTGKEAVVGMLEPGDFFGEGCLAGQPVRMGNGDGDDADHHAGRRRSTRWPRCSTTTLHSPTASSSHMLARNIRIEEDLVDQLFNSSEKRLARTLLLLARYGKHDKPARIAAEALTGRRSRKWWARRARA